MASSYPYAGRKRPVAKWPKATATFATGGSVSGKQSSTKHPSGLGDVQSSYLRGNAGGEAHEFYHATGRKKRTPADYGAKTKPKK
jgi:hypothetical protein